MLWARRVTAAGEQAARGLTELPGADLAALRRIFARALAADPQDRFETAGAFAKALRQACLDEAATTKSSGAARERRMKIGVAEPMLPLDVPLDTPSAESSANLPDSSPSSIDIEAWPSEELQALPEYRDGGTQPASVARRASRNGRAVPSSQPRLPGSVTTTSVPPLDDRRSGLLPLALSAVVFLAIGFAAGYEVASWQWPSTSEPAITAQAVAPADGPANGDVGGSVGGEVLPSLAPADPAPAVEARGVSPPPEEPAPKPPVSAPASASALPPPAKVQGRIVVRSTPAGARVSVDGRDRGRTPLTLSSLSLGSHAIRIAQDGYAAAERRLVLSQSRPSQTLAVSLEARPAQAQAAAIPNGTVWIESRPVGAEVYLDGRLVGTTPLQIGDVRGGEHTVRLELAGHGQWSRSILVTAGEQHRVAASLEELTGKD
jgi:hypothetical protein